MLNQVPHEIYAIVWGIMGASFGSFINVVAHRLPIMLHATWEQEAKEVLQQLDTEKEAVLAQEIEAEETEAEEESIQPPFNLSLPSSHCPICKVKIAWYDNIPIISWLILKAKCRHCSTAISSRYILVELLGLAAGLYAYLSILPTTPDGLYIALTTALFLLLLLAMGAIDINSGLLPDNITLPTLWLGLLAAYFGFTHPTLEEALLGAVFGYLLPWLVVQGYYVLTGKYGMGGGDLKMLAAMGAWLGFNQLPIIILTASLMALLYAFIKRISNSEQGNIIRFGPALAGGGILALIILDQELLFGIL